MGSQAFAVSGAGSIGQADFQVALAGQQPGMVNPGGPYAQ